MAVEPKEMTFVDHLDELRWHIIRSVIAISIGALGLFLFPEFLFGEVLLGPTKPSFATFRFFCWFGEQIGTNAICITELPFTLQSRTMTGQFTMHLTSSILGGLVIAFPYVFWEIWRFISPALMVNERKVASGTVFFVSTLFFIGVAFGYYVVSPLSINFLANYQVDPSIENQFDITSYISTLVTLVLASGIMFQLPILVFFFSKLGLLTPEFMRNYRRHSIVIIMIIAAVITPPDVFSQVLVGIPLILLYEMSIWVCVYVVKGDAKKESLEKY